jgi:phage-related minor tail protein
MSDRDGTAPETVDDAREKVEQTRADLTGALQDLTEKLDVKKQAKARVDDARTKVHQSAASVSDRASDLRGKAADALPAPVRRGIDATAKAVTPTVSTAMTTAKKHREPVLLLAAAGVLALVAVRHWRRS